jgi:hypothetical protein
VKSNETTPKSRKVVHDEAMKLILERIGIPQDTSLEVTQSEDSSPIGLCCSFHVDGIASTDLTTDDRVTMVSGMRAYWAGENSGADVSLFVVNRREYALHFFFAPDGDITPFSIEGLRFDMEKCSVRPPDAKSKETTRESRKVFHDEAMKLIRERIGIPQDISLKITKSSDSGQGEFNPGFFVDGIASADLTTLDRVIVGADTAYWANEKIGAFVILFISNRKEYSLEFCYVQGDDVTPFTTEGLRFDMGRFSVTPPEAFSRG